MKLISKNLSASIFGLVAMLSTQTASAALVTSDFGGAFTATQDPTALYELVNDDIVDALISGGFNPAAFYSAAPMSFVGAMAYENDFFDVNHSISYDWMLDVAITGTLQLVGDLGTKSYLFSLDELFPLNDTLGTGPLNTSDLAGILGSCGFSIFGLGTDSCFSNGGLSSGGIALGLDQTGFTSLLGIIGGTDSGAEFLQFVDGASQFNVSFSGQLQLKSIEAPVDVSEPSIFAIFGLGLAGLTLRRRRS